MSDPDASRYHIDIIHSLRRKHKAQQEHIKELQGALAKRNALVSELVTVIRCERETGTCVQIHDADSPYHGPCTPENCKYMATQDNEVKDA